MISHFGLRWVNMIDLIVTIILHLAISKRTCWISQIENYHFWDIRTVVVSPKTAAIIFSNRAFFKFWPGFWFFCMKEKFEFTDTALRKRDRGKKTAKKITFLWLKSKAKVRVANYVFQFAALQISRQFKIKLTKPIR